ncbi:MAG TPA: hypothetical protein VJ648_12620 [Vicinamibacteria bacterium]|nr:hypothetical protein [Vicinamibacteria bacterium]
MALALAIALACAACGGGEPEKPTQPAPLPEIAFVPTVPAPQPTPTPVPGSEPDPVPAIPGGGGGTSGTCGQPVPPPISRMNVKLHGQSGDRSLLDSTPIVGPDAAYCKQIGFTDGRAFCPVRVEGHPERQACEAARVGRASDSGRPGPTWSANGKRCNGPDGGASCLNHPDNQYLVFAYGSGTFRACTQSGVCGEVVLQ